jgi:hypothetical protein
MRERLRGARTGLVSAGGHAVPLMEARTLRAAFIVCSESTASNSLDNLEAGPRHPAAAFRFPGDGPTRSRAGAAGGTVAPFSCVEYG